MNEEGMVDIITICEHLNKITSLGGDHSGYDKRLECWWETVVCNIK